MSNKLKLLCMLALFACSILSSQLTPASSANSILLEHIGPQDASSPEIVIKVGSPAKSEGTTVLVGKEELEWLAKTFSESSSAKVRSPLPYGTYSVEVRSDKAVPRKYLIQPEDMDRILGQLFKKLNARGVQSPDSLVSLRAMLNTYRRE